MASQETPQALLILPSLSMPFKRSSLQAAYSLTLSSLFRKFTNRAEKDAIQRLDLAVVLPAENYSSLAASRAGQFPMVQRLLEEYYRLTCIIAAQEQVDLDFPGGIDVRISILDIANLEAADDELGEETLSGPLIDIHTFAASVRSYSAIYAAESEEGGRALDNVVKVLRSKNKQVPAIQRLPCGISISTPSDKPFHQELSTARHYSVAVGGTFDHIHIGHKLLLSATVFLAEPTSSPANKRLITIGITGDELLVNKKYVKQVESWEDRQASTAAFVESILVFHPDIASIRTVDRISEPGPNGRVVRVSYANQLTVNYTQISDPFGPTVTDEDITALVISKETRAGGKAVNDKRAEKGWKGLEIFEVDVLDAGVGSDDEGGSVEKTTFEAKISSTEIRRRLEERDRS